MLKASYRPYTLNFAFVAHTSRETFTEKPTFIVEVYDSNNPQVRGVGEIAVFPSLQPSFVSMRQFIDLMDAVCADIDTITRTNSWPENSAIRFGFETALKSLENGGRDILYPSRTLSNIKDGIPINGLVWMNDMMTMKQQVNDKIKAGFRCIKLKIGALNFNDELNLLREIRRVYSADDLEIRVDANGAFTSANVMMRLNQLAEFNLHSIEQPLPRDSDMMADVCRNSPVPIALDEDMIERWWTDEQMFAWLSRISPSYIVLKPSLVGGFVMADRWIVTAESLGIGWWVTSALESNIGLSAIAQWLASHPENLTIHHGLGTGNIYKNNLTGPVRLRGERLFIEHDS